MRSTDLAHWVRLCAALCGVALISSCGGGAVGSGGTGALPDSVSVGTVNGYGSVVIDGVAYDDRQTAAVAEIEPGRDVAVEALLGQRVEVASDAAGVAKSLRVDAALAGAVTS
ncbi:MAG TPA: hypothetical protein VJ598_00410, partial [Albitalea sp.]|nr:hypothetical protein [Albitalea sp.]